MTVVPSYQPDAAPGVVAVGSLRSPVSGRSCSFGSIYSWPSLPA